MKTRALLFFFLLVGCSSETTKTDGGDDGPVCGVSLCSGVGACSACPPGYGTSCDPAGLVCDYWNGCSGAQNTSARCTCVVPDAGADANADAGDAEAGAATATWQCVYGV